MEQKEEEESLDIEDNFAEKSKLDWSHLNDIESLITQMNSGKKLRCIVYDTETTGINHKKHHILELAGVEVVNFCLTGRTFHIYIKPRVFVPKNVQELNHINYDDYQKYWEYYNQDTKTQLQNFLDFVGKDSYLVAHNAPFDYYFLNAELKYWGLPELPNDRFRCTLRMVKTIFKNEGMKSPNFKLFTCCEYFHILVNKNEGSYHNALFDTIMTSKLLVHLYKKYANIDDYEIANNNNKKLINNNANKQRYNKFDPENINKKKERKKEYKKNEKVENKQDNYNNNHINENKYKQNKEDEEEKEIKDNQNNINNNEISEGKLNGVELNLLIKKMNEMLVNEENKEKNNGNK